MKITYREAARDDLARQFRYYLVALNLPEVAVRFKESAKKTAKAIREHPRAGPPYRLRNPELKNLRSWPVAGFDAIRFYFLVELTRADAPRQPRAGCRLPQWRMDSHGATWFLRLRDTLEPEPHVRFRGVAGPLGYAAWPLFGGPFMESALTRRIRR